MSPTIHQLKKLNEELFTSIEENNALFIDAVCYIRAANISTYYQEIVIADIGRVFLEAEEIKLDVTKALGQDVRAYCDNAIAVMPRRTKFQRFAHYVEVIGITMTSLVLISSLLSRDVYRIVKEFLDGETIQYEVNLTIGVLLSTVVLTVVAIFILQVIIKNSLRTEQERKTIKQQAMFFGGFGFVSYLYLMATYGQIWVGSTHLGVMLAAICGFFALSRGAARLA